MRHTEWMTLGIQKVKTYEGPDGRVVPYTHPTRYEVRYAPDAGVPWSLARKAGESHCGTLRTQDFCYGTQYYQVRGRSLWSNDFVTTVHTPTAITNSVPGDHQNQTTRDEQDEGSPPGWPGTITGGVTGANVDTNLALVATGSTGVLVYESDEFDLGAEGRWHFAVCPWLKYDNHRDTWESTDPTDFWTDTEDWTTGELDSLGEPIPDELGWDDTWNEDIGEDWIGDPDDPPVTYTVESSVHVSQGGGAMEEHRPGVFYGRYAQVRVTITGAGIGADEFSVAAVTTNPTSPVGPIRIRTTPGSPGHGLVTGNSVTIYGVGGVPAANGTFMVTVIDQDEFDLDGTDGEGGTYTSGGTVITGEVIELARLVTRYSRVPSSTFTPSIGSPLSTGDHLRYNGTAWVNGPIPVSDIPSLPPGSIGNIGEFSLVRGNSDSPVTLEDSGVQLRIGDDSPNTSIQIGQNNLTGTTLTGVTAFGVDAADNITWGAVTAVGFAAGQDSGSLSGSFFGFNAGKNCGVFFSTCVGANAGQDATGVQCVTAVGGNSLKGSNGDFPSAIGGYSLFLNQGDHVAACGWRAGFRNADDESAFLGFQAGEDNTGTHNTAVGSQAFRTFSPDTGGNVNFDFDDITVNSPADDRIVIASPGHGFGPTGAFRHILYTQGTAAIPGVDNGDIWLVEIIDENTIELVGENITGQGSGTGHTLTPKFIYEYSTAVGAFAEPSASRQVQLGAFGANTTSIRTSADQLILGDATNTYELTIQTPTLTAVKTLNIPAIDTVGSPQAFVVTAADADQEIRQALLVEPKLKFNGQTENYVTLTPTGQTLPSPAPSPLGPTVQIPDLEGNIVTMLHTGIGNTQEVRDLLLVDAEVKRNGQTSPFAILSSADQAGAGTARIPDLGGTGTFDFAFTALAQNLTNKTITDATYVTNVSDEITWSTTGGDEILFDLGSITGDETYIMPNITGSDTLAVTDTAQTFSNKTLNAPIIVNPQVGPDLFITPNFTQRADVSIDLTGWPVSTTRSYLIPYVGSETHFALRDLDNTFSVIQSFEADLRISDGSSPTPQYVTIDVGDIAADRTASIPVLTANDTFAFRGVEQTMTALNTFEGGVDIKAVNLRLSDNDGTEQWVDFDVAVQAANRTVTVPEIDGTRTMAFIDQVQTFTAAQTFADEGVILKSASTGTVTLQYGGTTNSGTLQLRSSGTSTDFTFHIVTEQQAQTISDKTLQRPRLEPGDATLSSGSFNISDLDATFVTVSSETGLSPPTDNLDTITNGEIGEILVLQAEDGHTISVRHNQADGSDGNIRTASGSTVSLSTREDKIMLIGYDLGGGDVEWHELGPGV